MSRKKVLKRRPQKEQDEAFSLMNLVPVLLIGLAWIAMKVPAMKAKPKFNWNTTEYVYAFGDSYTFVQGTAGHPNFRYAELFNLFSYTKTSDVFLEVL